MLFCLWILYLVIGVMDDQNFVGDVCEILFWGEIYEKFYSLMVVNAFVWIINANSKHLEVITTWFSTCLVWALRASHIWCYGSAVSNYTDSKAFHFKMSLRRLLVPCMVRLRPDIPCVLGVPPSHSQSN